MTIGRRDNEDAYAAEVEADLAAKDLKERIAAATKDTPADELRALSDDVLKWFGWTQKHQGGFWRDPDRNLRTGEDRPHPLASRDDAAALMPEGFAVQVNIFADDTIVTVWPESIPTQQIEKAAATEPIARVLAAMAAKEME